VGFLRNKGYSLFEGMPRLNYCSATCSTFWVRQGCYFGEAALGAEDAVLPLPDIIGFTPGTQHNNNMKPQKLRILVIGD
jgi:hypothetical protein